ncbi:hypothetical protein AVEN_16700-1 [Araneus ventricosus]|uniref:Uncharacterized protein n=1 Tax=Araneus ventricosus TaxID=182803 RepID=A0A4Y2T564_ARAVE|nr:hypothetical protein AVEN_130898-1 [Araneus ventricosus]GBN95080.1 hypothetical protein AVEN_226234-1 [Araneus ventricosus]GBN95092.1 hypothetical protein AVEN_256827-1 [Araneus ventricosus]GBN95446.1 hypothetical protein AVEN_16700-1 [Araneus ventricosus]
MEILNTARKNNRQGRKPMENSIAAGETWISNQTKFQALCRFFRWADQSVCLEWDLASRLPNLNSVEWVGNRRIEDRDIALWSAL